MTTNSTPPKALAKARADLRRAVARANELERTVRRLHPAARKATELEKAIRDHHTQVVEHDNWGADDELWATLRLRRVA